MIRRGTPFHGRAAPFFIVFKPYTGAKAQYRGAEQAKEIMRYDYWRREALAWGKLKELLGHFSAPGDKARYERRTAEILDEIARQVRELLNNAQEPKRVSAMLESEAFADFFDRVLTHWDEIRSVKGYVKASLKNLELGLISE